MKKIAIVAPYKEYNYGTVLQAYALQKKISELGLDAEYLNFTVQPPKPLLRRLLGKLKNSIIPQNRKIQRGLDDDYYFSTPEFSDFVAGFESFINPLIRESAVRYNPLSLEKCTYYDAYLVGSDQTWGEARTSKNPIYFLEFINANYPKLSYAPSIGTTHISAEYLEVLKAKLRVFKSLSCREKTNCELLSKELNREVKYVLDPTLLLSQSEWNEISNKNYKYELTPKNYILCYILGEKECISEFAEKLGEETDLPVYYIVTRPMYLKKSNHIFATPYSFLGLIRDAETVVTDSFHGSVFSIIFNTNFWGFSKRKNNEEGLIADNDRIIEFFSTIDLAERFKKDNDLTNDSRIDFVKVNKIIESYRIESLDYLRKIVNNVL